MGVTSIRTRRGTSPRFVRTVGRRDTHTEQREETDTEDTDRKRREYLWTESGGPEDVPSRGDTRDGGEVLPTDRTKEGRLSNID